MSHFFHRVQVFAGAAEKDLQDLFGPPGKVWLADGVVENEHRRPQIPRDQRYVFVLALQQAQLNEQLVGEHVRLFADVGRTEAER